MDIEGLIGILVAITIILGWRLFVYVKKLHHNQNMYTKVGWIAEKENPMMYYGSSVDMRDEELLIYIMREQSKLKIPKEYCLDYSNEIEKENANEILNLHKNNVIKSYFSDFLAKSKNTCKLNSLEYYFYSLYCFTYKEIEEYKYNKDKVYKNKEYTDKNHYICQLTDYGRAFYKIYLITHMFVLNNENTRKLFEYINPKLKNHIMEYLETNKVGFYIYRP